MSESQANYNILTAKYSVLQTKYQNLVSDHNTLLADYESLCKLYEALSAKDKSISQPNDSFRHFCQYYQDAIYEFSKSWCCFGTPSALTVYSFGVVEEIGEVLIAHDRYLDKAEHYNFFIEEVGDVFSYMSLFCSEMHISFSWVVAQSCSEMNSVDNDFHNMNLSELAFAFSSLMKRHYRGDTISGLAFSRILSHIYRVLTELVSRCSDLDDPMLLIMKSNFHKVFQRSQKLSNSTQGDSLPAGSTLEDVYLYLTGKGIKYCSFVTIQEYCKAYNLNASSGISSESLSKMISDFYPLSSVSTITQFGSQAVAID